MDLQRKMEHAETLRGLEALRPLRRPSCSYYLRPGLMCAFSTGSKISLFIRRIDKLMALGGKLDPKIRASGYGMVGRAKNNTKRPIEDLSFLKKNLNFRK